MKLNTAFKLSALAAAVTFSTGSFAVDNFAGDIEVAGDIIADGGILVSGDSLVGGDIVADGNIEIAGDIELGGDIVADGGILVSGDSLVAGDIVGNGDLDINVSGLPAGQKSTLVVDANGTHVDASKKTELDEYEYTGTTLKYDTVVDKNNLVSVGSGLYVLKDDGSTLEYADNFKQEGNQTATNQIYNPNKLEFSSVTTESVNTRTDNKTATVYYDADGLFVKVDDVVKGPQEENLGTPTTKAEDTIIVGKEKDGSENAFTVRKTEDKVTTEAKITASDVSLTGKDKDGNDISSTLTANGLTTTGTVKAQAVEADTVTAKDVKADTVTATDVNATTVTAKDVKATDVTATGTVSASKITLNGNDLQKTLDDETKARTDADTDLGNRISTNTADIAKNTTAIAGFDSRISDLNTRTNQLNKRVDDVEKTAYRGVAIALAAQQNVPNIKPGQFAVFGGVGHYESESAFAMGVVGSINERTSISGAIGVAGGSEVGGRVGVAYVFGGK